MLISQWLTCTDIHWIRVLLNAVLTWNFLEHSRKGTHPLPWPFFLPLSPSPQVNMYCYPPDIGEFNGNVKLKHTCIQIQTNELTCQPIIYTVQHRTHSHFYAHLYVVIKVNYFSDIKGLKNTFEEHQFHPALITGRVLPSCVAAACNRFIQGQRPRFDLSLQTPSK